MNEIESKILEINEKAVVRKLKKFGAKRIFSGKIQAYYFDCKKASLGRRHQVLRLRQKGKETELVFKSGRSGKTFKIMRELETKVGDFNAMKQILLSLGFQVIKTYRKTRVSYALGRIHFEIDRYPGIPPLLEIEASSTGEVKKWIKKLGFSLSQAKSWSSFGVLDFYKKGKKA